MKIDKDIQRRIEEKERKRNLQIPELEAEARALQEKFKISGLTIDNLKAIADRSWEGTDSPVSPSFSEDGNGDYYHNGYYFNRADKLEDVRSIWEKLRNHTNSKYTNYISATVTYGPWQRRSFCGNGIYNQIISEEHGTIGRVGEGQPFDRKIPYGKDIPSDAPKEELLRSCLEFALQRYTENPEIKVELS